MAACKQATDIFTITFLYCHVLSYIIHCIPLLFHVCSIQLNSLQIVSSDLKSSDSKGVTLSVSGVSIAGSTDWKYKALLYVNLHCTHSDTRIHVLLQ